VGFQQQVLRHGVSRALWFCGRACRRAVPGRTRQGCPALAAQTLPLAGSRPALVGRCGQTRAGGSAARPCRRGSAEGSCGGAAQHVRLQVLGAFGVELTAPAGVSAVRKTRVGRPRRPDRRAAGRLGVGRGPACRGLFGLISSGARGSGACGTRRVNEGLPGRPRPRIAGRHRDSPLSSHREWRRGARVHGEGGPARTPLVPRRSWVVNIG